MQGMDEWVLMLLLLLDIDFGYWYCVKTCLNFQICLSDLLVVENYWYTFSLVLSFAKTYLRHQVITKDSGIKFYTRKQIREAHDELNNIVYSRNNIQSPMLQRIPFLSSHLSGVVSTLDFKSVVSDDRGSSLGVAGFLVWNGVSDVTL